jgi:hypothetical protein
VFKDWFGLVRKLQTENKTLKEQVREYKAAFQIIKERQQTKIWINNKHLGGGEE